jgi:glycosyltransferase involved in cell wall biosynthesis
MKITVAICTWNRSALLGQTLEQMTKLSIPAGLEWELLVVNNNCSDATDEVIAAYTDRLPLKRLMEPAPGHSNARNCAIKAAQGEFIVWTDDDVLVDEGWLREYAVAFQENGGASFFAGPIEPWFETAPPAWMARHLADLSGVIVTVDLGRTMRPLQVGDGVFGANLAVRRSIAAEFLFDHRLGRVKEALTGGDDSDFLLRLIKAGHLGLWVPRARVKHFVPRTRLTSDYVMRWFRDAGRTYVRRSPIGACPRVAGVPLWVLREYAQEAAKALLWRPTRNDKWFHSYRRSLMLRGVIQETRAMMSGDSACV